MDISEKSSGVLDFSAGLRFKYSEQTCFFFNGSLKSLGEKRMFTAFQKYLIWHMNLYVQIKTR